MFLLSAVSAVFSASMFIIPFLSPNGSFVELDGTPGIMDHWDIWSGKDIITMLLYSFGDLACHQQMSRTVILNGSEMPICIRDLGLLMGFVIGCVLTAIRFNDPAIYRNARAYIVIAFILIFTDWTIQHAFDLNVPITRLITGLLAGAGFSLIIYCWVITIFYGDDGKEITGKG